MPQGSKGIRRAVWIAPLLLLMVMWTGAGVAQAGGSSGQPEPSKVSPPADQQAPGSDQTGAPEGNSDSGFVFKTEVQEVVLHATVIDEHHRPVTSLGEKDFQVFEDGKLQHITSFRREDIPIALGIVIDNSGSMRDKRPSVNAAALNLVRASNPKDQVCVVNFNNEYYLDQDFTDNVNLLRDALEHIESRGGTALYDALVATSDHLMKTAKLQRKVILVVTDGEDTASHDTLEEAVRSIALDGGPAVYSIGIVGNEKEKRARRALRVLAEQTGGVAYFPQELNEVEAISQQIARDLRTQYMIAYRPTNPKEQGGYRRLSVKAEAPGYKGLSVRTRTGYYASAGTTASTNR